MATIRKFSPGWGERLRAARKKAGLRQDALAAMIGCHRLTVTKWETGKQTPSMYLHELCSVLGVKPQYLQDTPEDWVI